MGLEICVFHTSLGLFLNSLTHLNNASGYDYYSLIIVRFLISAVFEARRLLNTVYRKNQILLRRSSDSQFYHLL